MNDQTRPPTIARDEVSGGRCSDCGHFTLPHPRVCPECLSIALTPATVNGGGDVYAATVVRSGRKDRQLPYGLAFVDLAVGIRILAGYPVIEEAPLEPGTLVIVGEVGRSEADLPLLEIVERGEIQPNLTTDPAGL